MDLFQLQRDFIKPLSGSDSVPVRRVSPGKDAGTDGRPAGLDGEAAFSTGVTGDAGWPGVV